MASAISPPLRPSGARPQLRVVRAHSPRVPHGFLLHCRHCLRGYRMFPRLTASSVEPAERDRPSDTFPSVPTELGTQVRTGILVDTKPLVTISYVIAMPNWHSHERMGN
ncbi:hypothetical protein Taro_029642 [Colocasia esculenta]|uniref:Uncharacterized protein n=1 Tax=Colocasia esculenta TaxID=4460 RepID=A0A843VRQ9_COLES|nr:hypothetical protein [Colocasia esculenta]